MRRGTELPNLFVRLAGQTSQVLNITAAAKATNLEVSTASSYVTLLENLFLIHRLPAWGRTLRARATAKTFVIGELLKQATWSEQAAALGHWRTHDGQEVDLVVEREDGAITGFEIKAGRDVKRNEARGLIALRDALHDQFNAGFILTTGDNSYRLDDRIYVCPINRLWHPDHNKTGNVA